MIGKPFTLPDWHRVGGPVNASGRIRVEPEDFRVEERLGFEPSGDGQHHFLFVEKSLMATERAAVLLGRYAGVSRRAVSYSGLKDRRAVTRQWFSIEAPATRSIDWQALDVDGLRVISNTRNQRKLRRGAHRENAFELVIRDLVDPDDGVDAALASIRDQGVPNYFGPQRFGREGGNIPLAEALFGGRKLPRHQKSIAISAARSLIFNDLVSERVRQGSWNTLTDGDIANLAGSGSVFAVDRVDDDLARRCAEFDIHPTGPLWGRGAPGTSGMVAAAEQQAADRYEVLRDGLERVAAEGRRALRLRPADLTWERQADMLRMCFRLDRGAYATAVVRELINL